MRTLDEEFGLSPLSKAEKEALEREGLNIAVLGIASIQNIHNECL